MKKLLVALCALTMISGCSSTMTPTRSTEQAFLIIDVKGDSSIRNTLLSSLIKTTQENMKRVSVDKGIPSSILPETATRFELVEPVTMNNGGMGALMAAQGMSMKVPKCNNPLLTMRSDTSTTNLDDSTTFFFCVVQYKTGYQIDIYSTFKQTTGGLSVNAISKSIATSLLGDSSQLIPRTMKRIYETVKSVDESAVIVDSYIPENWKGTFNDETNFVSTTGN